MLAFDESNGECLIFVYREGFFSAVGHDLKMVVSRWRMTVDPDKRSLTAEFDPGSLRVVAAVHLGADAPNLSPGDVREIEVTTRERVLEVHKFPTITFHGTFAPAAPESVNLDGILTLHGRESTIHTSVLTKGDRRETELRLDQRKFAIRPYSAFLGALRVKPEVGIRLTVSDKRGN